MEKQAGFCGTKVLQGGRQKKLRALMSKLYEVIETNINLYFGLIIVLPKQELVFVHRTEVNQDSGNCNSFSFSLFIFIIAYQITRYCFKITLKITNKLLK